ncbi:carbon-nitrogen hydrolase family protein [Limnohabitans sp. JirII-31]|uniref:carbon-nitrogen hydrolase family protein n=1 Tax=Limnohabitans sp. JirII-31 TaxID=1977908 RepID=UPI000C1F7FC4|nr:carbon-nitrogen hydrolase family protein [Limnohabitans sp. JirII-31]PIT73125.1 amidohydrolase [Limnohabitans sp. JirII-31]
MNPHLLKVALLQMRASTEVAVNIAAVQLGFQQAARDNAALLVTPEMTSALDRRPGALLAKAHTQEDDPSLKIFCNLARQYQMDVLIGSMAIQVEAKRLANRSFFISKEGLVVAHYDKIHLFDVNLGEGERYQESARFVAGQEAVLVKGAQYALGMTVCYDLRFPQLYHDLALAGADILTVPSAFTVPTGEAHWHTLLRARAIETGCFVLAPAQHGQHEDGRTTYGHSLVVNPWGEVVAEKPEGAGVLMATLDLSQVQQARNKLPSLQHTRPYQLKTIEI